MQVSEITPHRDDWDFIESRFRPIPGRVAGAVLDAYREKFAREGRKAANLYLLGVSARWFQKYRERVRGKEKTFDDDHIQRKAKVCAREAGSIAKAHSYLAALPYLESIGVPEPKALNEEGAAARVACQYWWRRQLRKTKAREVEAGEIDGGAVHKKGQIYASDLAVKRFKEMRGRNAETLKAMVAVNEQGQEYTLQELAAMSTSNPHIRRSELMVRMRGLEDLANSAGHSAEFWTITCPSRFHRKRTNAQGGVFDNPKYDGSTPRDANEYLQKVWQRVRAKFQRENIRVYGFRVSEPQHDGTPHMHILLFMPGEIVERAREICRAYALQESPNEKGAQEYRFKPVSIDRERGSATGYIAKYISKNIDGYGIDADLYGKDINSSIERVAAWASTWGIRQFQQIGGPPVTVWRELRRLHDDPAHSELILSAWKAADNSEYDQFVKIMGGPLVARSGMALQLVKRKQLRNGGEAKVNRYGEPVPDQVVGVTCGQVIQLTRIHKWELRRNASKGDSENRNGRENETVRRAA